MALCRSGLEARLVRRSPAAAGLKNEATNSSEAVSQENSGEAAVQDSLGWRLCAALGTVEKKRPALKARLNAGTASNCQIHGGLDTFSYAPSALITLLSSS